MRFVASDMFRMVAGEHVYWALRRWGELREKEAIRGRNREINK